LAVVSAVALVAQTQPGDDRRETAHLVATVVPVAGPVAPGARVSLRLDVAPKPKMHVYSPEQKDYIPISLTLDPDPSFKAHPVVFPKAERFYFAALDETQPVFSKPFRITQDITLARARAVGGTLSVKGTLRYQACDDAVCYRPEAVAVIWHLTLIKAILR
jgi:hypothetical protein